MLDVSNVINVSLATTPAGLNAFNVNNLALFTTEQPGSSFPLGYKIYKNPTDVIKDYGSYSEAAKMAMAAFSQQPNLLSGQGSLICIPLLASVVVTASYGTLLTPDISASLSSFRAITAGSFKLTLDGGSPADMTTLDFSSCTTVAMVAAVIQAYFTAHSVGCSCAVSGNKILFTSTGTAGASSSVVIAAPSTGTDITGAGYLNIANAIITNGVAAYSGVETPLLGIVRTLQSVSYCGIMFQGPSISDASLLQASTYVQSLGNRIMFVVKTLNSDLQSGGLIYSIYSAGNSRTRCLFYTVGTASDATAFMAAYASCAMSIDFNGSNTTKTMHLKSLSGVYGGDTGIDSTVLALCTAVGADCYPLFQSVAKLWSNNANGGYFDSVYNAIWFTNTLQITGFNALAQVGTKIPQTEQGMNILKSEYRKVCEQAVTCGYIAAGSWTSTTFFGSVESLVRNILQIGYYIYSQPVALQNQEARVARQAPLVQIGAKEAGAIHSSNIIVYINS